MNRIIKFRGWDTYSEKIIDWSEVKDCIRGLEWEDVLADYPLMQFTGLHDKNGKEIYEGDILLFSNQLALRIVLWEDSYAKFEFHLLNKSPQPCGYTLCKGNANVIEIVGNIYENHELLETKND